MKNAGKMLSGLKWVLFTCFIAMSASAQAQAVKDTLLLKEFSLTGNRHKKTLAPLKQAAFDSLTLATYKNSNLAELISTDPSVFIKSYGSGLGTIAFRGTDAGQTKIFWNDVPVGSSAAGYLDLTIVPASAFDNATLSYGNASLKQGMGGLGGSVQLLNNNPVPAKKSIEMGYALGSFGTQKANATLNYGDSTISGSTRLYLAEAKNDYSFYNLAKFGFPMERQKNAGGKMYGALQQLNWNPGNKDAFSAVYWYQSFSRDIAQPMISTNGRAWKNDSSTRALLSYKHSFTSTSLQLKAAFTDENLHYHDYQSRIESRNKVDKLFLDGRVDINLNRDMNLQAGLQYIHDRAKIDGITEAKLQERASAFADYRQWIKAFQYELLVRQERINSSFAPTAFNASAMQDILKEGRLQIFMSGGRNYNFPALNDLYWVPGGNPNLKPELAYSTEGGLRSKVAAGKGINISSELTYFASDISNQIFWFPGSKGYFEAQNLKKVQIRGLELNEGVQYNTGKLKLGLNAAYTYTHSTSASGVASYDLSKGKDIIYIPKHNVYTSARAIYKSVSALFEYSYTGQRYTTPDNSAFLPPYGLANIMLSKSITFQKLNMAIMLKCRNIFDVEYQAIEWYPMSGRYFEAGLSVKL
jgi:vitamin B12 transporter